MHWRKVSDKSEVDELELEDSDHCKNQQQKTEREADFITARLAAAENRTDIPPGQIIHRRGKNLQKAKKNDFVHEYAKEALEDETSAKPERSVSL